MFDWPVPHAHMPLCSMLLAWLFVGWLLPGWWLAAACNLQPVCLRLAAETACSQYTP
jgi:hypothetical protein